MQNQETSALPGVQTPTQNQPEKSSPEVVKASRGSPERLIRLTGDRSRLPASFAQARLWFLDQMIQNKEVYNICECLRFEGPLDVDQLRRALEMVVARHESLRTVFASSDDGQPVQVISPPGAVAMPVVDLSGKSEKERETEKQKIVREDTTRRLDLAKGPVWTARLLRLGENEHELVLTFHNIIIDEWSLPVFFKDLSDSYQRLTEGRTDPLRLPPVQYADFGVWQRGWLQGEVLQRQLDYWKGRLASNLTTLQLPICKTRPKNLTTAGATLEFDLPVDLVRQVEGLSRRERITPFMPYLAAFQALLFRYSNQEDVVVGAAVSNRTRVEIEDVVGFFVNMVVMRSNLAGDPTWRNLLNQVRGDALGAFANQNVPFERLVEELRPARDPSRHPLFQVMFNFLDDASVQIDVNGTTWSSRQLHNGTAKFDLMLTIEEGPRGLGAWFEYNTDLFDADTIRRMQGHYLNLLQGGLANPDRKISELPLLAPEEQRQIIVDWNSTKNDYPRDKCMHHLVEEQVARTPDAVAVVAGGKEMTYRQLNERANQLAHYLKTLGVGRNKLVGICVQRSAEMIVGVLGILKAGGAYVPLDPNYPKDRLSFMIDDTKAPVIVTQTVLKDRLPESSAQTICLDTIGDELARQSKENLAERGDADQLAYIIYTSGSTGKPKGVVLRHNPVVNLIDWVNKTYKVGPGDRVLFVTSLNFDLSVYDIFGILSSGATNRVATADELRDPDGLLRILCIEPITFWDSAPPMLQQLVPFFPTVANPEKNTKLRLVFLSGDWIPVTLPDAMRGIFPRAKVVSLGGATEAAIWSNYYDIGKVDPAWPSIPYGVPTQNCRYHVLDTKLQPVPVGVPAELHIGGICLAEEYLNRPELNAEKFIPDPFASQFDFGGTRLYKTGDLARYFPDGNLEFLGRIDNQVKIRGFRIELGEIEAVIAQHPSVGEAVVVARQDKAGTKVLAGYAVPKPGQEVATDSVRAFLKDRLPEHMVPTYLTALKVMPLSPNGKIDRKGLPDPEQDQKGGSGPREIVAPRDDAEKDLVAIWEDVLKVKPISIKDNFFELGGHSFLAAVLTAKIKQQLGHGVAIGTLFAAPTVEKLATAIKQTLESGSESSLVSLQEKGEKPPLFLIAGVGGHVFTFHKFARMMGDQPVYGVKAIGVDGKRRPPDRMEEIAEHYVKEIEAVRPKGPYILGGYSVGAIVAMELALQLQARGHQVPLLIVCDQPAPGYPRKLPFYHRAYLHLKNFMGLKGSEKFDYIRVRVNNVKKNILAKLGLGVLNAPDVSMLRQGDAGQNAVRRTTTTIMRAATGKLHETDDPEMILKVVWANLNTAKDRYWPARVYKGKVLLYRASEGFHWAATVFDDPQLGWGRWCTEGIEDLETQGNHMEVFHEKNIDAVAAKLKDVVGRLGK